MQLKQKLLEHAVATLSVPVIEPIPKGRTMDTPPATPERAKERYDRESITVYALLADVKQEFERVASIEKVDTSKVRINDRY